MAVLCFCFSISNFISQKQEIIDLLGSPDDREVKTLVDHERNTLAIQIPRTRVWMAPRLGGREGLSMREVDDGNRKEEMVCVLEREKEGERERVPPFNGSPAM